MAESPISPAFRELLDSDRYHNHRLGYWLPKDRNIIVAWVQQLMRRVRGGPKTALDPTLVALQQLVSNDAILQPLSENMFTEVPTVPPYNEDPERNRELRSFEEMLNAFNVLLTQGPAWNDIANKVGLIGCPFNAVLDWPMATAAGYMFFLYPSVNECLKAMLVKWESFLLSPDSTSVLVEWFSPSGGLPFLLKLGNEEGLRPATSHTFPQLYVCPDPTNTATYGFPNWDAFFTRDFQPGIRPLDGQGDGSVIVHACESAPLQYPVTNVQMSDNFMGKNQRYSLQDMMDQHPLAPSFAGGTVYQAFLSCLSYHRWHAPVSGTIKDKVLVAGTYYSENIYQTFFGHWPGSRPDPAGPTWSQPYIASVAARGLIFIEADNPTIGLVCFIAIGMTDTSGCEFTVEKGQHVQKGDKMGMFHFGGSSYCLVFGPQAKLIWSGIPPQDSDLWPKSFDAPDNMPNFPVRGLLATVAGSD
jgi:phosphatidylserine decarboxylase